jgi:hypothetical protein
LHKPFERQDAATPLSEIAFRLVVNFYTDEPRIIGTATAIAPFLLISARHVLFPKWDGQTARNMSLADVDFETDHIAAVQIVPGPEYIVWDVRTGWADPAADFVLLHLGTNPGRSAHDQPFSWRLPRINPFAPTIGERIAAFGYRNSAMTISKNPDGSNHIAVNDDPMMSVGVVRDIHQIQRDRHSLPFPCYQVNARFDGGMSGGPVFDETGCLCGLVCSGVAGSECDGEPVSYVTTLWPLFRIKISADRGDQYPRGIWYPIIELARGGQIAVVDIERLEGLFGVAPKEK